MDIPAPASSTSPDDGLRCDVFCRVVDNYGDAAVCWRLALALAVGQGFRVRLWIDRPEVLCALQPALDPALQRQWLGPVQICRSPPAADEVDLPAVAIDAFGGGLPDAYAAALAARRPRALCIVLEYLTAEDWAAGVHRLASPHPVLDLRRFFFCPGFDPAGGGLLREHDLLAARDAFRADDSAHTRFLDRLGLSSERPDVLRVSLFGYANPGLDGLLQAMAGGGRPVSVALAPGPLADAAVDWFARAGQPLGAAGRQSPGAVATAGSLRARLLPFLAQSDYDRLLWSCDFNFVRGEDSLVRGLWAARPLCWQLYPQDDDAQCAKLEAFVAACERLLASEQVADGLALARLQRAWNGCGVSEEARSARVAAAWPAVADGWPGHCRRSGLLAAALASQPDLGTRLAAFCREQLK